MTRLLPWLRLVRLPAVFTAVTNVLAGFVLAGGAGDRITELLWAVSASAGIYLSGMAFNDVFDRNVDAVERPGRPLPSGAVPLAGAIMLASCLGLGGLMAATAAGPRVGLVAASLLGCAMAYDAGIKRTVFGPFTMGSCRGLNVMLGAATVGGAGFDPTVLCYAGVLGLYVASVTAAARHETSRVPPRLANLVGASTVVVLLCLTAVAVTRPFESKGSAAVIAGAAAAYLAVAGVAFGARSFTHPAKRLVSPLTPGDAPRAIGALIGSIAWFDAIAILGRTTVIWPALAAATCIALSRIGRRVIPIS